MAFFFGVTPGGDGYPKEIPNPIVIDADFYWPYVLVVA